MNHWACTSGFVATATVSVLAAACATNDPSLVASTAGAGGEGGAGPAGVTIGTATVSTAASSSAATASSATTGTGGIEEPLGPPRLVFIQGLVDRARGALCFVPPSGPSEARPWPEDGLEFASAADVPAASLPEEGDVLVAVVAFAPGAEPDATCVELLAQGAPEVDVATLGVLPRAALSAPRVLALITAGCFGGDEHTQDDPEGPALEQLCGVGYAPDQPTATLLAVPMSRIAPDERVAFQIVGGSIGAPGLDVLLRLDDDAPPLPLANGVTLGAAVPLPPSAPREAAFLGPPALLALSLRVPGQPVETAALPFGPALEQAGLTLLQDGRVYALAMVGPHPQMGAGPWWNAPRLAIFITNP